MKFTIISAAILASSISYSATPIDGWYGAVFGGYSYVPNNIDTNNNGWWRTNSSYQSGYDAGAAFGWAIGLGMVTHAGVKARAWA